MPAPTASSESRPTEPARKSPRKNSRVRDGVVVDEQVVLLADPATGRPTDAPPWAQLLDLNRLILVELRVLTSLIADETRTTDRESKSCAPSMRSNCNEALRHRAEDVSRQPGADQEAR
jgi:hypothetical protein